MFKIFSYRHATLEKVVTGSDTLVKSKRTFQTISTEKITNKRIINHIIFYNIFLPVLKLSGIHFSNSFCRRQLVLLQNKQLNRETKYLSPFMNIIWSAFHALLLHTFMLQ